MDKTVICEAMYALPGSVVVRRRKSITIPALIFAAGAAMIVLNNLLGESLSVNMRSAVVFVGGVVALTGAVMLLARLFGSHGAPYHSPSRRFLRYEELYFDRKLGNDVMQKLDQGEIDKLLAMQRSQVPAVAVALYRTEDNGFAAMQAYEYTDLEYRPLTSLRIVGQ